MTADESRSVSGFSLPAILLIDASKTYNEGALEGANLYPNLPPKRVAFDRSEGKDFKF